MNLVPGIEGKSHEPNVALAILEAVQHCDCVIVGYFDGGIA